MAALETLSKRFGMSEKEMLETLVLNRFSVSDMEANKLRRREEMQKVLADNPDPKQAFLAGYRAGWLHFQMRHGESRAIEDL